MYSNRLPEFSVDLSLLQTGKAATVLKTDALFLLWVVDTSATTTTSSHKQVFTNIHGTIVSPNYPKNYGNNEERYYEIIPPSQSEIQLIFNAFDLEHHDDCDFDSLQVRRLHFCLEFNVFIFRDVK